MSQQINLFNPNLIKKKSALTSTNLFILVLFFLVIVGGIYFFLFSTLRTLRASGEQSDTQVKHLQSQLQLAQQSLKPQVQDPMLVAELERVRLELADSEKLESLLNADQLGNSKGYSEYFSALARQIPNGVWITGLQLQGAGDEISVSGRSLLAEQVPVFVNQLKREKIMQGKTFAALNLQRPQIEANANENSNAGAGVKDKRAPELAPYLEFELHSNEPKDKKDSSGRPQ